MQAALKSRWYVWIFFFYAAQTLGWIFRKGSSTPLRPLDPSFFIFVNSIFVPLFCAWVFLSFIRQTENWFERAILILSAISFALDVTFTLHRLGYITPYVYPQISHWVFFVATVFIGYRTDQVLKNQDKRIETIACSTPS